MPLQQISLDQSIYNKNRNIRNTVRPAQTPRALTTRYAGELPTSNRFIDEQRALWAEEDKAIKERRAAQSDAAQELGLRVADLLGKAQKQDQAQAQQQQAMAQQVEQDPYAAAEEMFKFMQTLPEENQNALLQQIFTPTEAGGTITMGGRTAKVGSGEYNPIAKVFLEKGWAMVDDNGNVSLNRPVKEAEKGTYTYNAEDNLIVNTSTGETKPVTIPKDAENKITPEDIINVASEARSLITGLVDPSYIEGLTPEGRSTFFENAKKSYKEQIAYLFGLAYDVTPEEATKIANSVPELTEKDFTTTPTVPTTPPPTKTGDEVMANNIYNAIKDKPSISQEEKDYYINTYGADTWALVEGKLGNKTTTQSTAKKSVAGGASAGYYKQTTGDIVRQLKMALPEESSTFWEKLDKKIESFWGNADQKLRSFLDRLNNPLVKGNTERKEIVEEMKKSFGIR